MDPAVKEGTPAETSRKYAIATQQIVQNNMWPNFSNLTGNALEADLPSMDPSRPQDVLKDPSIKSRKDLSDAEVPVQYHASYNARLYNALTDRMVAVLTDKYR